MKRAIRSFVAIAALAALAVGASVRGADADATLGIETTTADPQAPQVTRAYLQRDRLKLELSAAPGAAAQEIIFRADLGRLWIVDTAARSYRSIDREQLQAMGKQMDAALKGLESELDRLPPAERKRVEQLMLGQKPSGPSSAAEFRKTERQEKIEGFDCVGYDYFRAGEKVGEAWLVSWEAAGLDPDTFKVFDSFQQFFSSAGSGGSGTPLRRELRTGLANLGRLDGFPLVIRDVRETRIVSESRMRILDRGPIAADRFEVPPGFTEQPLTPSPAAGGGK
jgi:hypothetical protein